MKVKRAENPISKADRPDFLAEDGMGRTVIIKCKGSAGTDAVSQIQRYGQRYHAARLMLVAFRMTSECVRKARRNHRIELIECDLGFGTLQTNK